MILKICGITNQDDASAAVAAGATALGFNFYPRSPRYLTPEQAGAIRTPQGLLRVGVFVNEPPGRIAEIARIARLEVAQLHGCETPADYPVSMPVWKAIRVGNRFDVSCHDNDPAEVLLLDAPTGIEYGGLGRTFDWSLIPETRHKIVLAGGLDATNVAQAIADVKPWGVDVCSRIESSPGKKDHTKMTEFLHAALKAAL